MPAEVVAVEGIPEACALLDEVSSIVATRAFVNGLDAAGEIFEGALWPRVPVDLKAAMNAAHGGKGALVTRIQRAVEVDARGRGGTVDVGFGSLGHIALWVEYGHRILGHKPVVMKHGEVVISKRTGAPMKTKKGQKVLGEVKPHPFMRPAFDQSAGLAVEAFLEAVTKTLKGIPGYSAT